MASWHSNFGVSETEDPLDGLLHHTIANTKHPPRVPTEIEPERINAHLLTNRSTGLHVPAGEGFVKEI